MCPQCACGKRKRLQHEGFEEGLLVAPLAGGEAEGGLGKESIQPGRVQAFLLKGLSRVYTKVVALGAEKDPQARSGLCD